MSAIAEPLPSPMAGQEDVPSALVAALRANREVLGAQWVDLVIGMVQERSAFGQRKYGQTLHTFDGRAPHLDALQELVDLFQYLHKAEMEHAALEARVHELEAEVVRLTAVLHDADATPLAEAARERVELRDNVAALGAKVRELAGELETARRSLPASPPADDERSSCDGVPDSVCDERAGCWIILGEVRCPAFPKESLGRRA